MKKKERKQVNEREWKRTSEFRIAALYTQMPILLLFFFGRFSGFRCVLFHSASMTLRSLVHFILSGLILCSFSNAKIFASSFQHILSCSALNGFTFLCFTLFWYSVKVLYKFFGWNNLVERASHIEEEEKNANGSEWAGFPFFPEWKIVKEFSILFCYFRSVSFFLVSGWKRNRAKRRFVTHLEPIIP